MHWLEVLKSVAIILAPIVGAWIGHRYTTPTDLERATLLAQIAKDAASVVVSFNPSAPWADLLRDLIARISSAAGLPTRNLTAIENAATAALQALGKSPAGGR